MASIDEAYLDMTGTERLHGPPLRAAHLLHQKMKTDTQLNCSIGIGISRLIAKVSSARAKPNGVLWIVPGQEANFLAPLDVREIPGVGKVTEQNLHGLGIHKVGDLSRFDDSFLEERFGKWGLALAGKARGEDAGGWFDSEVGADTDAKSISHEHTYNEDTASTEQLESTLMRLSEMVGRRLREGGLHARTLQLKLRYKDFTTITRAHTFAVRLLNSTLKSSSKSGCCFARTGDRGRRCGCWGCTRRRSRPRAGRETCWRTDAASAGSRPYRPPIVCATSSANPACRWPAGCEADSVNVLTRIRRDCRGRREKSHPKIINRKGRKGFRKVRKENSLASLAFPLRPLRSPWRTLRLAFSRKPSE